MLQIIAKDRETMLMQQFIKFLCLLHSNLGICGSDRKGIRGLSKKYPTLFFPGKTSDGRLANLITVVGDLHVHA
jgi:hypothetical protein